MSLKPEPEIGSIVLNIFLALVVLGRAGRPVLLAAAQRRLFAADPKRALAPPRPGRYLFHHRRSGSDGRHGGRGEQSGPSFDAHLEIVESVTDMPPSLPLSGAMIRIGRSPSMC